MLDRVYTMRYRSYSAENYISENSSLEFKDEYDDQPNSSCFLAYYKNDVVGSMRTCVYNPAIGHPVPIMEIFDQEIRNSIGYDNIFVELNKFVIDPVFQRKGGLQTRFTLMDAVLEETLKQNAVAVFAAVRPEHVKFYKMFGSEIISDVKSYPHLSFKTVLMMSTKLDASNKFLKRKLRAA